MMKFSTIILSITILFFTFTFQEVLGQNNTQSGKIKSRIVYEEKTEKGVKKTKIDSEEKYDQKGNTIEEIEYKDGEINKHMVYEYDTDNNRIKETELDATGKVFKTGEYKYENGLRKEKNTYDGSKKLLSKKTYVYTY